MNRYSLKGVLFDLDGVLIDSESIYSIFWDDIDRRYPTGIENFALAIKGTTLPVILTHFEGEELREQITRELNDFQDRMVYPLYPATLPFLAMLRRAGLRTAIVTSSDDAKMARLYAQHPSFADNFDVVIDASMVSRSKPDPEGYRKAAAALGLRSEECVVFEDSLQGLKAGRAAGGRVVALATTYPRERLEGMADCIIESLDMMTLDALRDLFNRP